SQQLDRRRGQHLAKRGILVDVDLPGTVARQFVDHLRGTRTESHGRGIAEAARFCQQLRRNRVQHTVDAFSKYPDAGHQMTFSSLRKSATRFAPSPLSSTTSPA